MFTDGNIRYLLTFLFFASACVAGQSAGVVSCPGPIRFSGDEINVVGVLSWAVLDGDEVGTTSAPAVIALRNGGRIVLGAQSKIRLEGAKVAVLEGNAFVSCTRECRLTVIAGSRSMAFHSGDRASVAIRDGTAMLTPGAAAPRFDFPARWLTERLPYDGALYLPDSDPVRP